MSAREKNLTRAPGANSNPLPEAESNIRNLALPERSRNIVGLSLQMLLSFEGNIYN
jgi:hypothetical protein